jgi:hypothetical protein
MIALVIVLAITGLLLMMVVYLLGFRLGGDHGLGELHRVRMEAAQAERQLHSLTRQAFVAMAEEAQRRDRR